MKTRADIQWLRAIAVAMVVLFHLWPTRLQGGFAGVDVFFVISGYLITGGLLRNRPRLADFWLRRIRRLLPTALVVILATLLASIFLVGAGSRSDFGADAIASATYFENWRLIWAASDYFAAADPSPFQHFWSLAVEEQFYLVWPLLVLGLGLWGASRGALVRARLVFGAVALVSFAWSVWQSSAEPAIAYLSTFTRTWEFAIGALIATGLDLRSLKSGARRGASVLGFGAVAASAFFLNERMVFPGWIALWPVLATGLVIAAEASFGERFERVLKPVESIGDISYGLYLWHWPIIVIAYAAGAPAGQGSKFSLLALSLSLASASKRWLEDPIRNSHWLRKKARWAQYAAAVAATIAVVVAGFGFQASADGELRAQQTALEKQALQPCFGANSLVNSKECSSVQYIPDDKALDVAKHDAADRGSVCMTKAEATDVKLCEFGSNRAGAYRVLLVGDSHAATHLAAFKLLAKMRDWHLTLSYHAGCSFSLVERNSTARGVACFDWNQALQKRLAAEPKFDLVVTAQYAKNRLADLAGVTQTTLADGLAAAWQPLLDRGSRLVAIRDNPEMTPAMKKCWDATSVDARDCTMPQARAFVTDAAVQAAANTDSVKLLDLTDLYCVDGQCPAYVGGVYIYRNADHISATYSMSMTSILSQRLEDLLGGF
ncbi:MAG: acyltransferase [Actinomycetales bacterium]|nr:acyltransferase [Actinomycetales bacterium]